MITFKALGRYGRFANQLFQIAGVIGIAIRSGQQFAFPEWVNYDHLERFGSTEDIDIQKYFLNPLPRVADEQFIERFVGWGYTDVYLPEGNWDLQGHFQSDKYFMHCIDTVRHYLKMKDEYPDSEYVAVHFRGGDYEENINAYHPRQTKDYYESAMANFPGSEFIVFSDDHEAAKKIFGNSARYSDGNYIEDFKLMKSCKHFICANSSYSLMAAILASQEGKKVVCPKKWFGEIAGINGNDCYHQNSIVL